LRVNILKLEEEQYLLLLSAHHIVIDGWSIGVLLQEVSAFYSAKVRASLAAGATAAIQRISSKAGAAEPE
jgi:hypothetical protein